MGQIRRHAFIAGSTYSPPDAADIAAGVVAELDLMEKLLLKKLGYESGSFTRHVGQRATEMILAVAAWRNRIDPGPDDWLLFYYSGHGIDDAGMLMLLNEDGADTSTARAAQDFVRPLLGDGRISPHVLMVFDTCRSGAARFDVVNVATRIQEKRGGTGRNADLHVVATTHSIEDALVGRFVGALDRLLSSDRLGSAADEHLDLPRVVDRVNEVLGGGQRASFLGGGTGQLCFFLNPAWVPRLQRTMDEATRQRVLESIRSRAMRTHWSPRARGVAVEGQTGWHFAGRSQAVSHIVSWLRQPGGHRVLAVHGRPGSGKSALLARLVTLSIGSERDAASAAGALSATPADELPPVDAIDVAVHARAKESDQLALEIVAGLQLQPDHETLDTELACVKALSRLTRPVVVVVDGLDEAARPADALALLRDAVATAPGLRLIVGVRDAGGQGAVNWRSFGGVLEDIDLDLARWLGPRDIERYVKSCLAHWPGSPYAGSEDAELGVLASAVAEKAHGSFLVASLAARALATSDTVLEASLPDTLPGSVGDALAMDLERFPGASGRQLRSVLCALAYTPGAGLPEAQWLAIATGLGNSPLSSPDLERWKRDASFYFTQDTEYGQPVWRLYHDEFARHFLRLAEPDAGLKVLSALVGSVPVDDRNAPQWARADPWTLAHLPGYMSAWGTSEQLFSLVDSDDWVEAKHRRFGSLGAVLADLDRALLLAQAEHFPDIDRVVAACRRFALLNRTAPPIVIDVIAGLGEVDRALAMAEAIAFPLDRCQAFALLAPRLMAAGRGRDAADAVRQAELAAGAISGHFHPLAAYWVVKAAAAVGLEHPPARVRESLLQRLHAKPWNSPEGGLGQTVGTPSPADRFDKKRNEFALPHWFFWAAMCLREMNDEPGLALVAEGLTALASNRGTNLYLQACAVAAPGRLNQFAYTSGGMIRRGNMALAQVEAGQREAFEQLRSEFPPDGSEAEDSRKRYAWALAHAGHGEAAEKVAAGITKDREEQARAWYRLALVAEARADAAGLERIAAAAMSLLERAGCGLSQPVEFPVVLFREEPMRPAEGANVSPDERESCKTDAWRLQSWVARIALSAGSHADAQQLCERVVSAGVVPSAESSLCMATQSTARMKRHIELDTDPEPAIAELRSRVFETHRRDGLCAALNLLKFRRPPAQAHVQILLALAQECSATDSAIARSLWIDALWRSRQAGYGVLQSVLAARSVWEGSTQAK